MQINHLRESKLEDLVNCFNGAFADYPVKMPAALDYWQKRWVAARVDYKLSYGMFDGTELVGFIINGIDFRDGKLTAFNTGTGVLPKYRGQRIVKQLYDFALPELKKNGVESCALEVMIVNKKAIKAYQSAGFEITKKLKCYSGTLKIPAINNLDLTEQGLEKINWDSLPDQRNYSWDNQKNVLLAVKQDYKYYEVFASSLKVGYFIINPLTGNLAQFDLTDRHTENDWQKLFSCIKSITPNIKINNVDDRLTAKIKAIENAGLAHFIDQYEMEFIL